MGRPRLTIDTVHGPCAVVRRWRYVIVRGPLDVTYADSLHRARFAADQCAGLVYEVATPGSVTIRQE